MRRLRPTRTQLLLLLSLVTCGGVFAGLALTASHQRHPAALPGGAPAAPGGAPSGTARIAGPDTRIRLVGHGVTPRVSSLAVTHPYAGPLRAAPARESEHQTAPAAPSRPDGALQTHAIGATPGLAASFDGLANSDNAAVNNGLVNIPPDTVGDVGPSNYVEAVNASGAIYSKNGAAIVARFSLKNLWANVSGICKTHNNGDPIVLYDSLSDRWIISQFAIDTNRTDECIAVSQTGNPAGTYWVYDWFVSTKFADYPKIGVWPDGYYFTFNDYVNGANSGVTVIAFSRSDLQNGLASPHRVQWDVPQSSGYFGLLPADVDGPAPPATQQEVLAEVRASAQKLDIVQIKPNYANPGASTWAVGSLSTAAFDGNMCNFSRACLAQPGTANKVDALAGRLLQRLAYRNLGSSQELIAVHVVDATSTDRAGVRWYELRKTTGGWFIGQQGTYSPDSTNRWDGSGAMDKKGDIAVGFSAGSGSIYPSIRYAGRVPSDFAGTLESEATLQAGGGSQLIGIFSGDGPNRWGDYTAMNVDPSNGCTFWYLGEYYSTSGNGGTWKTRIGSFKFPSCS